MRINATKNLINIIIFLFTICIVHANEDDICYPYDDPLETNKIGNNDPFPDEQKIETTISPEKQEQIIGDLIQTACFLGYAVEEESSLPDCKVHHARVNLVALAEEYYGGQTSSSKSHLIKELKNGKKGSNLIKRIARMTGSSYKEIIALLDAAWGCANTITDNIGQKELWRRIEAETENVKNEINELHKKVLRSTNDKETDLLIQEIEAKKRVLKSIEEHIATHKEEDNVFTARYSYCIVKVGKTAIPVLLSDNYNGFTEILGNFAVLFGLPLSTNQVYNEYRKIVSNLKLHFINQESITQHPELAPIINAIRNHTALTKSIIKLVYNGVRTGLFTGKIISGVAGIVNPAAVGAIANIMTAVGFIHASSGVAMWLTDSITESNHNTNKLDHIETFIDTHDVTNPSPLFIKMYNMIKDDPRFQNFIFNDIRYLIRYKIAEELLSMDISFLCHVIIKKLETNPTLMIQFLSMLGISEDMIEEALLPLKDHDIDKAVKKLLDLLKLS